MRSHSPSRRRHSSASVGNSSTPPTPSRPRRKSDRVKSAFRSISSYLVPEESDTLADAFGHSLKLATSVSTAPRPQSTISYALGGKMVGAIALPLSETPVASRPSSIADFRPAPKPELQPPQSLWEKAFDKLPVQDQLALGFGTSTKLGILQEVIEVTKQKRDMCIEKQWKMKYNGKDIILRDVADKLLKWVERFKQIGNFVAQCDTAHAGLPWEACKFLLTVSGGDNVLMGTILVAIERIAVLLSRCAIHEGMYLQSGYDTPAIKGLEKPLTHLYGTILYILGKARRYYERNTAVRMATAIFDTSGILPMLDDMDTAEAEVIKAVQLAEESLQRIEHREITAEISGLQDILEDIQRPILRMDTNITEVNDLLQEAKRADILTWICKVTYGKHHEKAKKGRMETTGQWFLEKEEFKEWQTSSASMVLWLCGIPGSGKTKLTSVLIDVLLNDRYERRNSEGFAYFYCGGKRKKRREPDSIFRAILKQLSREPNASSIHQAIIRAYKRHQEDGFSAGDIAIKESKTLIIELLNIYPQTTIVIDALNECEPEKQEEILKALQEIVIQSSNLVKIFISSREDPNGRCLSKVPISFIETEDNTDDICAFVEFLVSQKIEDRKLLSGNVNGDLEGLICSALQHGSNGSFTWVEEQVKALCDINDELDLINMLKMLPTVQQADLR